MNKTLTAGIMMAAALYAGGGTAGSFSERLTPNLIRNKRMRFEQ
ncbi:MAG: hypothetical protein WCP55_21825 [Lentisphaerota bacterium]